ncbi:MAG: 2'-5' RNA ligase family protein, partial [Haloarculaceae archaeon]
MYSLNVPVPTAVSRLATDIAADLPNARARTRGDHTLVCKRLGAGDASYHRIEARVRDALTGTPAFAARVASVDLFEDAATGPSPVVYLAVESPGLEALHERLCDVFDPADGLEGDDYVPHVTIARGGSVEAARRLAATGIDPVEWTVSELVFY